MRITVLPVSGGGFCSQLSILSCLPEHPKIMMATSGGNLAAYIGMAADFDEYHICRLLGCIKTEMFLKNWWPTPFKFLPSWIAGYGRGAYYNHGSGVCEIYNKIFNSSTIGRSEIWTGVTDCSLAKAQIFCNRPQESCSVDIKNYPNEYYTSPLVHLNGCIDDIATVCLASCAIPSIIPPVNFKSHQYSDGGSTFASPLTPMSCLLCNKEKIHIDYINSFDIEAPGTLCLNTIESYIRDATTKMIQSMTLADRANGINLVAGNQKSKLKRVDFGCCQGVLPDIYKFRKHCKRSMVEIFPCTYMAIDYSNYNPEEAKKIFWTDRSKFKCRLWYVGDKDFNEEYPDTVGECSYP